MEHLLFPDGAKPIYVPYVCTEIYEDCEEYEEYEFCEDMERMYLYPKEGLNSLRNFSSFWERRGWKYDSTGRLTFENRTPEERVAFLQTWLYFGCLISVFRSVGITVRTSQFVRASENGERVVSTLKLPELIAEWAQRESSITGPVSPGSVGEKRIRGRAIKEILDLTSQKAGEFGLGAQGASEIPDDTLSLVRLSIMALGESLCSALVAIHCFDVSDMPTWGPSPVLKRRLRDAGWCTSDSPFFPESLPISSISADYYFGGYTCPRRRYDHSECSAVICRAYQQTVDTRSYTAKHVSACVSCDHIPAPEKVVEIVRKGGIPIIFWDGKTMHVTEFAPSVKYVAISHVWSDGFGNDEMHNSLPRCQLSRIQQLVSQLYAESHLSLNGVYMPEKNRDEQIGFWLNTLCVPAGEHNSEILKSVIGQKGNIFRQADRVLVLDSFIQQLPREADITEKYARLHLSAWHHQLSTFPEGQLGKTLLFQFQDGAETFYDMMYPERHLDPRDAVNICSPVRVLCATQLEAFYRHFETSGETLDISTRMRSCARYLRSRQTSKLEDEPFCLAMILGLDPDRILAHEIFEDRMKILYESVKHFDPRVIFNNYPRLQRDGYRWAPRSFLHQQVPDLITVRDDSGVGPRSPVSLLPNGTGLPVRFPGFELHNVGRQHPGSSVFVVPRTDAVPLTQRLWPPSRSQWAWWKHWYKLQVHLDDAKDLTWNPRLRYAVVMYADLHPDFLPAPAIIGTIDEAWQHPLGIKEEEESSTQTDAELKLGLEKALWTPIGSRRQLPMYEIPQRIAVRYVCRANVTKVSQVELIDAKMALWPHLRVCRKVRENLTYVVNSIIGQNNRHLPPPLQGRMSTREMAPVSATVYSRMQKWCIL